MGDSMRHLLVLTFAALICGAGGCGTPRFLITPLQATNVLEEVEVQHGKGAGKIAVIPVEGMLINARSGGFLQPTENPMSLFTQDLEQAEKDKAVKAVVLRVNS